MSELQTIEGVKVRESTKWFLTKISFLLILILILVAAALEGA